MHDEAERDRKRDNGEFRHRRIAEPPLVIHTQLPEDDGEEEEQQQKQAGPESLSGSRGGAGRDGNKDGEVGGGRIDETVLDGIAVGGTERRDAQEAWSLVTEEVGSALWLCKNKNIWPVNPFQP